MDEGFARRAHPLVVFGHAPVVADPCKCSLCDPTARQVLEARAREHLAKIHLVPLLEPFPSPDLQNLLGRGLGRAIDPLDLRAMCLLDPILAPTSVEHASTHRYERRGRREWAGSSRRRMPSWSGTFALCTLASTTRPSVSTSRCLFLPLTILPPSKPLCSPPTPVVLADCASTMPALGSGSRPSFSLNSRRIGWFILSQVPSSFHALK